MGTPAINIDPYIAPPRVRHRIDVAGYHQMGAVGLIAPGQRTELIEGEVIDMAPIGSRHAARVKALNSLLTAAVGNRAIVAVQDPVILGLHSEPQPDLSVLRPREDFYADAHPQAKDLLLAVEVADTTLAFDRGVKLPLYAAGLPSFGWWIWWRGGLRPTTPRWMGTTATWTSTAPSRSACRGSPRSALRPYR